MLNSHLFLILDHESLLFRYSYSNSQILLIIKLSIKSLISSSETNKSEISLPVTVALFGAEITVVHDAVYSKLCGHCILDGGSVHPRLKKKSKTKIIVVLRILCDKNEMISISAKKSKENRRQQMCVQFQLICIYSRSTCVF